MPQTDSQSNTASEAWSTGHVTRGVAVSVVFTSFVGFCVGFTVVTLVRFGQLDALVASNAVSLGERKLWLSAAGATAGAALIAQIVALLWNEPVAREWLPRIARAVSPLILLPALPPLLVIGPWDNELYLLATLAVIGLSFEQLLRVSFGTLPRFSAEHVLPMGWRRILNWLPWVLLGAAIAYYFATISRYTIITHYKLYTSKADLGEFTNLFYNALAGHPFRAPALESNTENWSALKIHAEFVLYLFLPIFALAPQAETLLVMQTGVIGSTALPVFLLARRRLGSSVGLGLAFVYLLWPAVQRPNFYDFHFTPFAAMFVAWLLYFLDRHSAASTTRDSTLPLAIAFTLALLTREDVAMGLVVFGFAYAAAGPRPMTGLAMGLVALVYVAVLRSVVHAAFGSHWFPTMYATLQAPGAEGFTAIAWTLATNPLFVFETMLIPEKLVYVLHLTVPLLFLWLRRPMLLAAAIPGFFFTLVVTDRPPLYQSSFQYTYLWVPYLLGASILALDSLRKRGGPARLYAAVVSLLLVSFLASYHQGVLLGRDRVLGGFRVKTFEVTETDRHRLRQLRTLVAQIPQDASVAATERNAAHVAARVDVFPSLNLVHRPDYVLIGYHMNRHERARAVQALTSGNYGVVDLRPPFALLRRGANPVRNPEARSALRL